MAISLRRGTNISHFLSQSQKRGPERAALIRQRDIQRIADWGFDHIRLPIDEEQMWNPAGRMNIDAFDLMDNVLDWCEEADLRAVVDLHILRSHHFLDKQEPRLFADPAEAGRFAQLWRDLSLHLQNRPNEMVAYELMNEPVARDPASWNRVAAVAHAAIRELEPDRYVVLGSNNFNSPDQFDRLDVPAGDRRIVLTFHFYKPLLITHYRAHWCEPVKDYDGPVQYPGQPIPEEHFRSLPADAQERLARLNQPFDRAAIAQAIAQPLAVRQQVGRNLYCGEFGVYNTCPRETRLAWLRDVAAVLGEHNIGWANWDYKGKFGLVDEAGQTTGIAEAILGLEPVAA